MLAAEAPPDAFGIAIGRHATVDSIISVTRLIPCAGAQYVTPAEKNMLLCEAAANGKLMKEYGRPPRSRCLAAAEPRPVAHVACWAPPGGHQALWILPVDIILMHCVSCAGANGQPSDPVPW